MPKSTDNTLKPSDGPSRLQAEQPQQFSQWISSLRHARGGQDLLDRMIAPSNSAELVKALPVMTPCSLTENRPRRLELILAMASGEQIQARLIRRMVKDRSKLA